ncbi:hypothetical protein QLX67_12120, partial [Balneolaceae bacterium ANBcel3]|nr:hypothetical protein [Balneolaceae bacterium ANBcel3]
RDCYQFIKQPGHEIVRPDAELTELLVNSGYTLLCEAQKPENIICTYSPRVHNQPPEKAWIKDWETPHPTLLVNNYGKGKVVYFANQPDQSNFDMGHPDLRNTLNRSIRYLIQPDIPVSTNAPESVHIGLTQSYSHPGRYVCSLVNTSTAPKRPMRTLIPVRDIEVTLRLDGRSMKKYSVLRSQGDVELSHNQNEIRFKVRQLDDFCALHIEMNT